MYCVWRYSNNRTWRQNYWRSAGRVRDTYRTAYAFPLSPKCRDLDELHHGRRRKGLLRLVEIQYIRLA